MAEPWFKPALGVVRRMGLAALRLAGRPPAPPRDLRDPVFREVVARRICVQTAHSLDEIRSMVETVAHLDPNASDGYLMRIANVASAFNISPSSCVLLGSGQPERSSALAVWYEGGGDGETWR